MTDSMLMVTENKEWLEADGLGGFASGTAAGIRTRRYHGLLLAAMTPPTGRVMLVNGVEAWIETAGERYPLCTHRYLPDVIHPHGQRYITAFAYDPWPRWTYEFPDLAIEHELFVVRDTPLVLMHWRVPSKGTKAVLHVRPLASGRDIHALHYENPHFRFDATVAGERVTWQPYEQLPTITAISNGSYHHDPLWYRNYLYREEQNRGLDFHEDLASFGTFTWDLSGRKEAILAFMSAPADAETPLDSTRIEVAYRQLRDTERRRRNAFPTRLHRAADAYIVRRGSGKSIVAGYPWFTDWGRDTFISLRGLCLTTGRLDEAREILLRWAGEVSQGMLPNRFVEAGDSPEFNSVDAALWYVIAVSDFLRITKSARKRLASRDQATLRDAIEAILTGYANGTRHGIGMDTDGLLRAGEPGLQLTWMDAKVGDWVVTPRIGKPVEVQALWLNALKIGHDLTGNWLTQYEKGRAAFQDRFWYEEGGYLYDVVDVNHQAGEVDASFRPNQILAIGGLPLSLYPTDRARRVVDAVEQRLWAPIGLRTLEPGDGQYRPHYEGGVYQRDGAYHQGTVWPWLIGPFVDAWVRVRGDTNAAREEADRRFLTPLLDHLDEAGLGHVSEIADADAPHQPRGCPFQAWSVGEALRVAVDITSPRANGARRRKGARGTSKHLTPVVR